MKRYRKSRSSSGLKRAKQADPPAAESVPTAQVVEPSAPVSVGPQLARRIGDLEEEIRKARKDALDANARASALERKLADLTSTADRVSALEADLAALRKQVAQAGNRTREESRKELAAQKKVLLAELEALQKSVGSSESGNAQVAGQLLNLLEKSEVTAGRVESLERELSSEAERHGVEVGRMAEERKAQGEKLERATAEAADLRETAERRGEEIQKLESVRKEQENELDQLREAVAGLKQTAQESAAPVKEEKEDELFPSSASVPEPEAMPVPEPESPAPSASVFDSEPSHEEPEPVSIEVDVSSEPEEPGGGGNLSEVELGEPITRDAMGAIYRAKERESGDDVAVRILAAQDGEEQTAAVEAVAQKLIGLPHPNILQVYGSGRRGREIYIRMELVQAEALGKNQIREIPRICMIFRDIAEAIDYAHEEGILHGDLNPDTIMLNREEEGDVAIVKDFGLAHVLEAQAPPTLSKEAALTIRNPAYLPPDQLKEMGGELTVAADVYGIGATLYTALCGRAPFEGKNFRQVRSRVMIEEPPPVETIRRDVPPALAVIVRRAMAKEPRLRYASAKEFAVSIKGFLEGKGTRILSRPTPAKEG